MLMNSVIVFASSSQNQLCSSTNYLAIPSIWYRWFFVLQSPEIWRTLQGNNDLVSDRGRTYSGGSSIINLWVRIFYHVSIERCFRASANVIVVVSAGISNKTSLVLYNLSNYCWIKHLFRNGARYG